MVLGNTPNKFTGLQTIGKVVFVFDLVLFVLFSLCMLTRFLLVPRKLLESLHHPVEGLFFGTYWVSLALILNCTYIYGDSATGPWLTKGLEVTYWMYCAAAFLVGLLQYSMFFRLERLNVADAVPAWIFPIYPLLVVGTLAGTILPGQPPGASWKIFVSAIMFKGLAWLVSFLLYGLYMQRLMTHALPSPSTRPGMFVSVGPAGKSLVSLRIVYRLRANICRLHCCRTPFARESSTRSSPSKLLDNYFCSRRRNLAHYRHRRWSFRYTVRVLVLPRHNHCRHSRSSQNVVYAKLVGFYFPKCRTHARDNTSREGAQE